jgi:hypothetical protein
VDSGGTDATAAGKTWRRVDPVSWLELMSRAFCCGLRRLSRSGNRSQLARADVASLLLRAAALVSVWKSIEHGRGI